jgi:trehalose-phosphatase
MRLPVVIDPRQHDGLILEIGSLDIRTVSSQVPHRATAFVHEVQAAGVRIGAFYSVGECARSLAGVQDLFPVSVEGSAIDAAVRLGVSPERCVLVDHTAAGIRAGRAGGFGLILGVGCAGDADELLRSGADAVVPDVVAVTVRGGFSSVAALTDALASYDEVACLAATRRPVVLLDFDGTISEIVTDPEAAKLLPQATAVITELSTRCPVAVLSGRRLADVRAKVGIPSVWYGGSHGIELVAPDGAVHQNPQAIVASEELRAVLPELRSRLAAVDGINIEDKHFSVAVHYRNVPTDHIDEVVAAVLDIARGRHLRFTQGRMVIELRLEIHWDKGRAANWMLDRMVGGELILPIYIGDDSTDEDAFDALRHTGIGIAVRQGPADTRRSSARFSLSDPDAVCAFLARLNGQLADEGDAAGDSWTLTFDGYDPHAERLREALCTTGNGYMAMRGAAPEVVAGEFHYPGLYGAGVYNRLTDTVAGTPVANESLVNLPNWLPATFRVDGGPWFDIDVSKVSSYRLTLDIRRATWTREFVVCDEAGRSTAVTQQRFVSMQLPHVAAMMMTVRALDWSGLLEIRSMVDGGVANTGVARYRELSSRHLHVSEMRDISRDSVVLVAETTQSKIRVAVAVRNSLRCADPGGAEPEVRRRPAVGDFRIGHDFVVDVTAGLPVILEKTACVYTSRDHGVSEAVDAAAKEVVRVGRFAELQRAHQLYWAHLWERFTIDVGRDAGTLRIARLHQLHLLQTLSPHTADLDVGVPARGLHGEAYRGHVFWDELFVFPVTNLRMPEVTRALLMYRHRRLAEARIAARERGYRGAMFPWQSGSSGREESQRVHLNPQSGRWNPDASARAHHIGIAIAYNTWQYYQVTGDSGFLIDYGAEMLIEIARFWVSLASFDKMRNRYVIDGVIGPDEFHSGYPGRDYDGIDNNAYTNVMAVWVIMRALDALERIPMSYRLALLETLDIDDDELVRWEDVSRRMFVPSHDGVISQFEGYEQLQELDWDGYRSRYDNLQRLDRILEAEGDSVNKYKAAKQADTLMLFYLLSADELYELFDRLGYSLTPDQIPATIDYYRSRTSHGSTLSAVVHSWVMARGNRTEAMSYFKQALDSDVVDIQRGTTAEGIHLAAMAGTIDLLQRCFTGLEIRRDRIMLGPMWPEALGELAFPFRYRGHRLQLRVIGRSATLSAEPSDAPPVTVECRGRSKTLFAGGAVDFSQ